MRDYDYDEYDRGRGRGRSRTRARSHREYSPSEVSVESHYSRRRSVQRSVQRDPTYDDPSYQVDNTRAVVVRQEYPVAAPASRRSGSSDHGYSRNRSRRRTHSVDTTQVYYPTRDGYYYERREYSTSPVRDRQRLQRRSYRSGSRRRRSPSPAYSAYSYDEYSGDEAAGKSKWKRPAEVAAKAAAFEAFRLRKEPGSWMGAKGTRVATVALAAAGINRMLENGDPERKSTVKTVESILGAKIVNRMLNGPKKNLRYEY